MSQKRKVLSLYRNILVAHRTLLPTELKGVGNEFVRHVSCFYFILVIIFYFYLFIFMNSKKEFRLHKKVPKDVADTFFSQWYSFFLFFSLLFTVFNKNDDDYIDCL